MSAFFKKSAGFIIFKAQGFSFYRKAAKFICPNIEIREAIFPEAEEFYRQVVYTAKEAASCNNSVINFVAENNGRIIGAIQLIKNVNQGFIYPGHWLFSLNVKFCYRGMGIGERLIQSAINRSKEENADELSLLVSEKNRSAIKLYEKLGFINKSIPVLEEQLKQEALKNGSKRILMVKGLS